MSSEEMSEEAFEEAEGAQEGTLSRFHGHTHSKVPIIRLLRNNLLGLGSQILVSAGLPGTSQHCPAAAELQRELEHGRVGLFMPLCPASIHPPLLQYMAWVSAAFYATVTCETAAAVLHCLSRCKASATHLIETFCMV